MHRSRTIRILTILLGLSISLNAWQFLRPAPVPHVTNLPNPARTVAVAGPTHVVEDDENDEAEAEEGEPEKPRSFAAVAETTDLAAVEESELVFGTRNPGKIVRNPHVGSTTLEEMRQLAKQEPSKAAKFRIHAVMHLPGERVLDLGTADVAPGLTIKLERLREFPFPTSIAIAKAKDFAIPANPNGGSFPVTPTTPGDFEVRHIGVTVEVDVTPTAGALVLGGQVTHRSCESFGRMPGELFAPIATTG